MFRNMLKNELKRPFLKARAIMPSFHMRSIYLAYGYVYVQLSVVVMLLVCGGYKCICNMHELYIVYMYFT